MLSKMSRKFFYFRTSSILHFVFSVLLLALSLPVIGADVPIYLFPLEKYDQNIETWLNPKDVTYDQAIVSGAVQKEKMQEFYKRFYSTDANGMSPWNAVYIERLFQEPQSLAAMQEILLSHFSNEAKDAAHVGYGENFRPYSKQWLQKIENNMNLKNFQVSQRYNPNKRGILIQNTMVRVLPVDDVYFYHFTIAGEGYPFDNLQISALYAGTPVYSIGKTQDSAWTWIISPYHIGWVRSENIANVTKDFIDTWQKYAKKKLVAITRTETPIIDNNNKQFQFTSYVGAFFPLASEKMHNFRIVIPKKNTRDKAVIHFANVSKEDAVLMPLTATRKNFARVIKTLQNRPYGWGGMYFYTDCSLELKNLYVPFGFYLPVHSSAQIYSGRTTDKTSESPAERLNYLIEKGHPLMTIVYTEGHVFLYVDKYDNPYAMEPKKIVMSYQQKWGLKPKDNSRRAILGQGLFLPILETYSEDTTLESLASAKIFKIINLTEFSDEIDNKIAKPTLKSLLSIDD